MANLPVNPMAKVLKANGINQLDVHEDLQQHGIYVSRTGFLNWLRYGIWPQKTNPQAIRESIERLLDGRINNEELDPMFETAPQVETSAIYGVIPLLRAHNRSVADLRRSMELTGVKLSPSALTQILRHGQWPKTTEQDVIKAAIEKFMHEFVTRKQLLDMWIEKTPGVEDAKTQITKKTTKTVKPTLTIDLPEPEMLSKKAMNHFKLTRHPFENEVRSESDLFMSDDQVLFREAMVQASVGGSILAVIGECGAGKTAVRKGYIDYVQRIHPELIIVEPMVINKKRLTAEMIFEAIAEELNISTLSGGLEKRARKVNKALRNSCKAGNSHALIIEEAHDLSNNAIKYLKRIWEMSDGYKNMLSIILIGQPELEQTLSPSNYEVREFAKRCNVMKFPPLGRSLTDYIAHKFKRCNVNYLNVIDESGIEKLQQRLLGKKSFGLNRADSIEDVSYPLNVNNLLVNAMNYAANYCEPKITADVIEQLK